MIRILFLGLLGLPLLLTAQLQNPSDFLPHRLGETFTPHHMLVNYFEHAAANSNRIVLTEYGQTNEDRPLLLAYVSTPENLTRLEDIRKNNLRRTGVLKDGANTDPALDVAIVWLSFSVHGNEASGSEASMGVLYDLLDPANPKAAEWLANTVVILDPALNPDGYSRYTNWYRQTANKRPVADPAVREHDEPWPGGRVNHYLFDLNRDWAWQTQVESRQRAVQYQRWMPHVHADIHEQGANEPYYFAPAAAPFHRYITDWQGDFQTEIGRNHARYFDREGWLYFTRERFDLFYPSYGDTYPTFNGAIGMTYEQGGLGRGRAIELDNGDTLTLYDRVAHHRTTALSTVETASREKERLVRQFGNYFRESADSPSGEYRTYVVKAGSGAGELRALTQLLDNNGIEYSRAKAKADLRAYGYREGKEVSASIAPGDLIVRANQPRSVLTQVLFDPTAELEDSVTYDITAWSVPLAYGLDAYASTQKLSVATEPWTKPAFANSLSRPADREAYAYAFEWRDFSSARLLAALLGEGIRARAATGNFRSAGRDYGRGTVLVTRADNRTIADLRDRVARLAEREEVTVYPLASGFSDSGADVGSGSMQLVNPPKIALLGGEGTYPNEFGQVWHFFEQQLDYPVHIYYAEEMDDLNLTGIDVLVLPEGRYQWNEETLGKVKTWVRAGGRLIAIGAANRALVGEEAFGLTAKTDDPPLSFSVDEEIDHRLRDYQDQERESISDYNPGSIFKLRLDQTHPLAYGLGESYFSLKTNSDAYDYLEDGWNVGTIPENDVQAGFVGYRLEKKLRESLSLGVMPYGRGQVVMLADNPLYRGFWQRGKLLFSNALFMVQ